MRLESVQNAIDQAKCVARRITGNSEIYDSVAWFWSDQGSEKLQIAGLTIGADQYVVRRTEDPARVVIYAFRNAEFLGIESVNAPFEHMTARKILASGRFLTFDEFEKSDFNLRAILAVHSGSKE